MLTPSGITRTPGSGLNGRGTAGGAPVESRRISVAGLLRVRPDSCLPHCGPGLGVTTQPASAPTARTGFSVADRFVLRMAVAATLGFAISVFLGWEFSFLVPMLAVQMVAGTPGFPTLQQGVAMPIIMWIGTTGAMIVASVLAHTPFVQLIIISLVIYFSFYAQRRGAPAVMTLFVQIAFCAVPLYATVSLDAAHTLVNFLQRSAVAAAAILFISHLLVPAPLLPPRPSPGARALIPPGRAARVALADSLVLLPLLVNFMLGSDWNNFVILMMTINILNDLELSRNRVTAFGLIAGNTVGGLLAVLAQQLVLLADTFVFFLLVVFLSAIWFAGGAARGGPKAPLFGLALGTFLLILGLAVTPLPGGSEQTYLIRILQILFASVYALGALILVSPLRRGEANSGDGLLGQ